MGRLFVVSLAVVALLAGLAPAQDPQPSERSLKRRLARKMAMDWVTLAEWTFEWEEALEIAEEENLLILAYFTRTSKPNAYCTRIEQGPLVDPEFVAFSEKIVPFCHIETGLPDQKLPDLLMEKGGEEPPYLVFLSSKGEVLGTPFGHDAVKQMVEAYPFAQSVARLRGKAKTTEEKVELFVAEVRLGQISSYKAGKARKDELKGLSSEQKKAVDSALLDVRIPELLRDKRVQNEAEAASLGKRFYHWHKKGLQPMRYKPSVAFWNMIRLHGKVKGDADIYEVGYLGMKSWYEHRPQSAGPLRQMAGELRSMRGDDSEE